MLFLHLHILPQNPQNPQKLLAEKKNLWASVKSVGEYTQPNYL